MQIRSFFISLFMFGLPASAVADHLPPTRFEITPMIGVATGGSFDDDLNNGSFDVDDNTVNGLAFHITSVAGGQYEFSYWREDTSLKSSLLFTPGPKFDVTVDYLQIGGTYPSDFSNGLYPYVVATIGASRWDPDQAGLDSETFFAGTIGAGLRYNMTERLALKLEGRALGSFVDSNGSVFCFSNGGGGCVIAVSGNLVTRWTAAAGLAIRW